MASHVHPHVHVARRPAALAPVAPSAGSLKASDAWVSTSAHRRGLAWVVVRLPRPNMPPSRSPRPPPDPLDPKMSPRSKPPAPPGTLAPAPNSDLASSYSARRLESDSTL